MNKHNAKKFLPIIQALADGEEIECKCIYTKTWKKQENICFDEEPESYRIKPEPRTFKLYIIDTADGKTVMTTHPTFDSRWKQITVQEVLQ
jgi:hypothetical protein